MAGLLILFVLQVPGPAPKRSSRSPLLWSFHNPPLRPQAPIDDLKRQLRVTIPQAIDAKEKELTAPTTRRRKPKVAEPVHALFEAARDARLLLRICTSAQHLLRSLLNHLAAAWVSYVTSAFADRHGRVHAVRPP